MITSSLVAALLAILPVSWLDRHDSPAERVELLMPVAEAAIAEAATPSEAVDLMVVAYQESRFARYVLEYRCQDGPVGQRCDRGRAWGPWQVHRWCEAWGTPDLAGQARCALKRLRQSRAVCRARGRAGALAGYRGSLHRCLDPRGEKLAAVARQIEQKAK